MNNDFNQQPVAPVETVVPNVAPVQPVAPMGNVAPVQPVPVPTKKKSKLPIIIIVLLLLVAGGGVGVYFAFFNKVSSRQVVNGAMNQVFNKALQVGNKLEDYVVIDYKNDVVNSTGKAVLSVDGTMSGEKISYKNIGFDYDIKLNAKDLSASSKININEGDKKIINLDAFVENKVLYANSNLFDTPYKSEIADEEFWNELKESVNKLPKYSKSDTQLIVTKLKTYLNNAIKDEYLSQDEGNYTIDGVSFGGLKTTVEIDQTRYYAILNSIYSQMAIDDEFLTVVSNYGFVTKEDLTNSIMDELDSVKETQKDLESGKTKAEGKLDINIYTTKNGKFQALEVRTQDGVVLTSVSENDIRTYKIYSNNEVSYTFTYNEVEKEYTFKIDNNELKIKKLDDGLKITYTGNGNNLEITLTSKSTSEKVNSNITVNGDFVYSTSKTKLTFTYDNELKKTTAIDKFDVSSAVDFAAMTPEQQQAIVTKLGEVTQGTFLESYAQMLMYSLNPTPSYDMYQLDPNLTLVDETYSFDSLN